MIKLVAGDTGEGKTKDLIVMANEAQKTTNGHIVYLDNDCSHMYDLNHNIRYTNISDFPISNYSEFFGFMCGILSEDSDINVIFADGLLRQAHVNSIEKTDDLVSKLQALSNKFSAKFVFSVNCDTSTLPAFLKEYVVA